MSRKRRVAIAVIINSLIKKRRMRRTRKCWVKEWIAKRSTQGAYAKLLVELRREDLQYFENFLRMSVSDFEFLVEKVQPKIKKQDTVMRSAISVGERLAVTLKFLAGGESYHSLMYLFRIPVSTISSIIPQCCEALYEVLKEDYMKMPTSNSEWNNIARQFEDKWNFPNCIGALDGKHIILQAPKNSGSHYFNYKGCHSIVLMALVDANYKFLYVDVGCNGRVSDSGVFGNCSLSKALEQNILNIPNERPLEGRKKPVPFVMVGDDAFALKPYIMKPYPFRNQPGPNRIFNYRLSRARRVVENAFGQIANRFRILRKPIELGPEKATKIVLAICSLHNFLLSRSSSTDSAQINFITEENQKNQQTSSKGFFPLQPLQPQNYSYECKEIRSEFTEYFCSPMGEVPWQYKCI